TWSTDGENRQPVILSADAPFTSAPRFLLICASAPIASKDWLLSRNVVYAEKFTPLRALLFWAGTVQITIREPGSSKGRGRSSVVLIRLKITVLAPIPSASDSAATMVKPGCLTSIRSPYWRSCQKVLMVWRLPKLKRQTELTGTKFAGS